METIKNRQAFYQKPSSETRRIRSFLMVVLLLFLLPANLSAQQKHALLIGISDKILMLRGSVYMEQMTYENRFRA